MGSVLDLALPRRVAAPVYAPPFGPAGVDRRVPSSAAPVPVESKILRPSFRPLRLSVLLSEQVRQAGRAPVEAWVLAAAAGRLERSSRPAPPARWLAALEEAFACSSRQARARASCRAALERHLPDAAWASEALLGEMLLAARAGTAADGPGGKRTGRSGRRAEPSVYTPPGLARRIVAAVHVGPRRLVDPACGAGIFLLLAFERAFQRRVESGQAPAEAAKQTLIHELAGIDVDAQALALASFSLRLAGWEAGGVEEDVPLDLRRADALDPLPDLDASADAVAGNPPFVEGRGLARERLAALRARFRCAASGKVNLFAVFVERGLELLRPGGVLSFVLPATFRRNERYRALRELLLEHTIEALEPVEEGAFEGRVVETCVLRVRKGPPARSARVTMGSESTPQRRLPLGPGLRFGHALPEALRRRIERMERLGVPLSELFEVRDGISTGFQPFPQRLLGRVDEHVFIADDGTRIPFDPQKHVRVIDGSEFAAFTPVRWEGRSLEYDKSHEHQPPHPGRPFNCQLRERAIFDRPEKLLTRQTARGLIATLDRERYFPRNSVHVTFPKGPLPGAAAGVETDLSLAALCACLNSKFYESYFLAVTGEDGNVFPQVHVADLKRLPMLPGLLKRAGALCRAGEDLLSLHAAERSAAAASGPQASERIEALKHAVEKGLGQAFGVERESKSK